MITISASVGWRGVNRKADVLKIQRALNAVGKKKGQRLPRLKEDSLIGPNTIGAIRKFQKANARLIRDGRVDKSHATLARINALLGHNVLFSDMNLFGPSGPSVNDIKQDAFGDCYFVATLGAVAQQAPMTIRSAIHYDVDKSQFRARLFDLKGQPQQIWVTQAELQDNVRRRGGSYVDNTGTYARTWPAIIETAYAKMHDTNPADGLGQGYQKIINGGYAKDAMMAITGSFGRALSYTFYPTLGQAGSVVVLGSRVNLALSQKKSVTLVAVAERDTRSLWKWLTGAPIPQDGLVDSHLYSVVSIVLKRTDWQLTLRNPWGTNMGVGEGMDNASATMTFSLLDLVKKGGLHSFQVSN